MRTARFSWVILLVFCLPIRAQVAAPGAEERLILDLEQELFTAYARGDIKTLDRILADTISDTPSNGVPVAKQDNLRNARPQPGVSFDLSGLRVQMYSDVAIVSGVVVRRAGTGADAQTNHYRTTDTFLKRNDVWRLIATQQNSIPVWRARTLGDAELRDLPQADCADPSLLKPLHNDTPAFIRFMNTTSAMVTVRWVNPAGQPDPREDRALVLQSGAAADRNTFLTHAFIVADSRGACVGVYTPNREPGLARIHARQ